ncbi:hypothetical protein G6F56_012434 [Rhizopus delemar]|nr:hypothetical protein G6F56_012434 [Rhizopus delemar]
MKNEKEVVIENVPKPNRKKCRMVRFIALCSLLAVGFYKMFPDMAFHIQSEQEPRLVLHTGFPPLEDIHGLSIFPGKAAAASFSPKAQEVSLMGESWWDRLFPSRHVHLTSVEIPVRGHSNQAVSLSICPSERGRLGTDQGYPDLKKCLSTLLSHLESSPEEPFGVVEWVPEDVVVLKKTNVYWLVVQSPDEGSLDWVYAQRSKSVNEKEVTIAFQSENGWQMQLKDEPVPSVMLMVEEH